MKNYLTLILLSVVFLTGCPSHPPRPSVAISLDGVKTHITTAQSSVTDAKASAASIGGHLNSWSDSVDRLDRKATVILENWPEPTPTPAPARR